MTCSIFAQTIEKTVPDAESIISNLYRSQQVEDINYSEFYEALYQFYLNPLDLNSSEPDELRSIYILNDVQITAIFTHIKSYGPFHSVFELQSLPDFSVELIRNLLPFITVRPIEESWKGLSDQLRKPDQHYFLLRESSDIEKARGYKSLNNNPPAYQGSAANLYFRYRLQKFKSYSFGLTAEKDAGETLEFDKEKKKYGADFLSVHAMVYNRGRIKKIVIGDYQLQFGQGLVLSGGFFTGKGSETVLSARRSSTGIRPYTSLLETSYLRGLAATISLGRFELTPFISQKYTDASVSNDTLQDRDLAVLQYSGLHRTISEIKARSSVKEQLAGLNCQYISKKRNLQLGINLVHMQYDKVLKTSARFYNLHEFNGVENQNGSVYYSYFFRNISFFGEAALSKGGGKGGIQGLMFSLGPKVDMSLVYRNYSKDLHTPYGNSFGENYKNSNEKGLYWGIKIRPNHKTEFAAYYDTYQFPWLKFRVSAPSVGQEYLVCLKYKFNKKTILFVQFREENKEKDTEINLGEKVLSFHKRRNASIILELNADKHFHLKSRAQASSYESITGTTFGYFIAQDLAYDGLRFNIIFRSALFDTDDFENRQYAYENDVLYSFSIPFFSGRGLRNYVVTGINLSRNLGLWLKYSRTTYFDRQVSGSGNEEVEGNVKSEIRSEIRYMF